MEETLVNVTSVSALDGFVLKGQPAQECQLHVHLAIGVALILQAGWRVVTPQ